MSLSGTTCTRDTSPFASISLTKSFQEMLPPLVLMELSRLMMRAIMKRVRRRSRYIWSSCSRRFFSSERWSGLWKERIKRIWEKQFKMWCRYWASMYQSAKAIHHLPSSSFGVFPFGPLLLFFCCLDCDVLKKFVASEINVFFIICSYT